MNVSVVMARFSNFISQVLFSCNSQHLQIKSKYFNVLPRRQWKNNREIPSFGDWNVSFYLWDLSDDSPYPLLKCFFLLISVTSFLFCFKFSLPLTGWISFLSSYHEHGTAYKPQKKKVHLAFRACFDKKIQT